MSKAPSDADQNAEYARAKSAWESVGLAPLWESADAHRLGGNRIEARHWGWDSLQEHIARVMTVTSPEQVERRVLLFADPQLSAPGRAVTSRTLNAGLQVLLPGETARPHRHTLDAIRLVLSGRGAVTIVDGRECEMSPGDLILTPGDCWHEHIHRGTEPVVWLDGLNGPLHRFLGTAVFEAGPPTESFDNVAPDSFVDAALAPDVFPDTEASVFHYKFDRMIAALRAAPVHPGGFRRVRYVNPQTKQSAIPLMDLHVMQVEAGASTIPFHTNSNAICVILGGHGETTCGDQKFKWGPRDIFVAPQNTWTSHRSHDDASQIFVISDREVYRRLGLLKEAFGNRDSAEEA